uniref:Uncharacterized protein n=1 Tax=Panagrolaimus davidi TaxID=227884 RepID=A0A914PQQ6_9BILA
MKLRFASLHLYSDGNIEMNDILEAFIGVPNLRIWYGGECGNSDDFGVYLVEWILENGYIDSFCCIGHFLGENLTFKSEKQLTIWDTFDLL